MTIKECIDIVDNLKPNQYSIKDKVMWLSFIEEIIINEVLKTHEGYDGRYDRFEGYSEEKLTVTLIVPSPFDRLYTAYLKMKIDENNGETTRYNNSVTLYNSYMNEYKKYYNKTHMPVNALSRRNMIPQTKTTSGLSDAEYENLKRDMTYILTEYFSNTVSDDKVYDVVTKFVQNNIELLSGKGSNDSTILFKSGSGENSLMSANAKEAISDGSVAFGPGTVAGVRGYYIKSVDLAAKKIYLTKTQTQPIVSEADFTDEYFETPEYEIGQEFVTVNSRHYWAANVTIKAVHNNVIEYDDPDNIGLGYKSFAVMSESSRDPHDFCFFVPMQPTIGCAVLKPGGFGAGYEVYVLSKYGTGGGYKGIVFGNYGTVFGRVCRAGGSAFAVGQDCWALENQSIAMGNGLRATADTQSVFGRYNRIDNNLHHMIGNGSETARSNCYELTKWGTAWYADKILVGGRNIHDPNAKVVATEAFVKEQMLSDPTVGKWALTSYISGVSAGLRINTDYPIEYAYVWRVWLDGKDISGELHSDEAFVTAPLIFEDTSKIKLTIEAGGAAVLTLSLKRAFKTDSISAGKLIIEEEA